MLSVRNPDLEPFFLIYQTTRRDELIRMQNGRQRSDIISKSSVNSNQGVNTSKAAQSRIYQTLQFKKKKSKVYKQPPIFDELEDAAAEEVDPVELIDFEVVEKKLYCA